MKRANGWTLCLLTASSLLLIGCATGRSEVPAPESPAYSQTFQTKAADELSRDSRRPCDRIAPVEPCSALARMVIDYGHLRSELRALSEDGNW